MSQRQADAGAPVTEKELDEWEARAHQNGSWSPDDVLRLIAEVRRLRHRAKRSWITRTPGKCGGAASIAGTRIRVADVVALARRYEWDLERVRAREFPDRLLVDLVAAVEYYRGHKEEIDETLRRDEESRARLPLAPLGR